MQVPKRITFQWLRRETPTFDAADYELVLDTLVERGWVTAAEAAGRPVTGNFIGLLEALLPTAVRDEVVARRYFRNVPSTGPTPRPSPTARAREAEIRAVTT